MTILLQVQLLPSSPSPDEKPLKQKKRPPEGSLFLERKTRLERRLACVCLSRTPLSRLRRQLPRGAVASPSPDEKSLKQKKETSRRQSLLRAENETRTQARLRLPFTYSPQSAAPTAPSGSCRESESGRKVPQTKKRDHPKAVSS